MRGILFSLLLCGAGEAIAHGEDKPGPHGGFISMPGSFHVELVQNDARTLKVYLLDIHWKNPIVKESDVELKAAGRKAECAVAKDHYLCRFPNGFDLSQKGEVEVRATRDKQKGNPVKYELPLRLPAHH